MFQRWFDPDESLREETREQCTKKQKNSSMSEDS